MKNINQLVLVLALLSTTACGQIQRIMDGTENLPNQIAETNRGMANTNENIRMQKISISLAEMQKKENRTYLSPVPGDMMPYGRTMAEALTVEETLLFCKNTLKKVNEEGFSNRFPNLASTDPEYAKTLAEFEHEKLADLMMVTIVAGFLPDATVQAIIDQEAEQGAYQDVMYQLLMLRSMFNSDLMLNASVMNTKLETVGKINKAIEYNQKVDFIDKLDFADQIGLKVTGFTTPEMNYEMKLDTTVAATNWNRIYTSAQSDFKAMSHKKDPVQKHESEVNQAARFAQSLEVIKGYIKSWGSEPTTLN